MSGQRTAAGSRVLDALHRERPFDALLALRGSPGAARLVSQLFVVSLRRCFAGRDPREITCYVRDLLEWRELPARGRLARRTEALIRAVLEEPGVAAAVPAGSRYQIMCHVVGDLARPPGAPPGLLEALIEQAERRADRYPEPVAQATAAQQPWNELAAADSTAMAKPADSTGMAKPADSTGMAEPADSTGMAEPADSTVLAEAEAEATAGATVRGRLRSAAGVYLRATAVNEPGPVNLHPDYPARLVFYCAFERAVRRRFRTDCSIADIVRTVANAARRHPFVPMDGLAAEMLIRDALGEVVPVEEVPLPVIVATHLVVFAAICDELALTDKEIDTLIATAEEQAERLR